MAHEPRSDAVGQSRSSGDDRRDERGGGNKRSKGKGRPRKNRPPRSSSPLKAGLFASVADKEVPCRVEGCSNTWTWGGVDQMKNLGQPPPQRMCDEHLAEFNQLEDEEIPCRNPTCSNTWTWKRGAQLHQLQKHEKLKTPSRLCASCFEEEKNLGDVQVKCKVGSCKRTWTWTRDAQVKHRAWLRRLQLKIQAEEEAERKAAEEPTTGEGSTEAKASEATPEAAKNEAAPTTEEGARASEEVAAASEDAAAPSEAAAAELSTEGDAGGEVPVAAQVAEGGEKKKRKKKRRRKRKRKLPEGPPEKMCSECAAQIARLEPIEQPCKVHGCARTWVWSKEHQLRAWAALGTDDPAKKPTAPRRMCTTCRDFCREHPDKQVPCGRPGCDKSWAWKTGAQLQAHLAGKTQEPIRLCDHCVKGEFLLTRPADGSLPPGAEIMPCVVPACDGTWIYLPGMQLTEAREGEAPPDRMCDKCRAQRGLEARGTPGAADPTLATSEGEQVPEGIPSEENSEENSQVGAEEGATSEPASEPASEAQPEVASEPAEASPVTEQATEPSTSTSEQ